MDHDRMDVFCQLPCVVEYAGLFVVVVHLLVSNACGLGEKARVGVKVEGAGQETALLEDGSDVTMGACVASVDVHCFWGSRGGTGGGRWVLDEWPCRPDWEC